MRNAQSKKKRKWFKNIFLLIIIVIILLLLDGRFGIGGGDFFGLMPAESTTSEEGPNQTTEGELLKVYIEIMDNKIIFDGAETTLEQLGAKIGEVPGDTVFILKDTQANNTLFSAVEDLLKNLEKIYTIEE